MKIRKTLLEGAVEIECTPHRDARGWFARYFCQEELDEINGGREIELLGAYIIRLPPMKKIK